MHAPLRPDLSSRVAQRLPRSSPIADEWRALAARALEPNVFYEPAFALAAAPVFGADAGAVLVRTAAGKLVGLFPARIERWRGGCRRCWSAGPIRYAPLGMPLVDRDEPEAVIAAWLDHLGHDPAMPAQLLLPFVPEQGAFAAALDAVLARDGRRSARLRPPRARPARARRGQRAGLPRARDVRRQAEGTAPPAPAARGHRAGHRHHRDRRVRHRGRAEGFPGAGGGRLEGRSPAPPSSTIRRSRLSCSSAVDGARRRRQGADRPAAPQRHRRSPPP